MNKAKLAAAAAIVLVALIVFAQNTAPVETKFLFITLTMPRFTLLAIAFGAGALTGAAGLSALRRRRSASAEENL
jgi:uncharacterized integral membrane protein